MIDAPALLVTLPPLTSSTPPYFALAMLPVLVTVPAAPVTKTPNELPETDPVELFVTLPPSARSMAALPVPVALMLPLLVTVPAARYLT